MHGCWFHAKTITVGDGFDPIEDDEDEWGEEGTKVAYLVADHEGGDQIDIELDGNSSMAPETALELAGAIQKVLRWSRTKVGKVEIQRLRDVHEKRDEEERVEREAKLAAVKAKKSAPSGCAGPK